MKSGDLVKEKKRLLRKGEVARIGIISTMVCPDLSQSYGLVELDLSSQTLIMSM
jgi:hypothetical protein